MDKFKQYFLGLVHYTSNPDYLATSLTLSYSTCTKQHNFINNIPVKDQDCWLLYSLCPSVLLIICVTLMYI